MLKSTVKHSTKIGATQSCCYWWYSRWSVQRHFSPSMNILIKLMSIVSLVIAPYIHRKRFWYECRKWRSSGYCTGCEGMNKGRMCCKNGKLHLLVRYNIHRLIGPYHRREKMHRYKGAACDAAADEKAKCETPGKCDPASCDKPCCADKQQCANEEMKKIAVKRNKQSVFYHIKNHEQCS